MNLFVIAKRKWNVRKGVSKMDKEQAINIAVTCVMASALDNETKTEVIEKLREKER